MSSTLTLPWVLPMYHRMEKDLRAAINNPGYSAQMKYAAQLGLDKLDHYHKLAKGNQFYVVATGALL
jgi:hypothetical protein